MQNGTIDLLVFGLIFLGLQAWWIFPLVRNNNVSNKEISNLAKERNKLEKLFKK